MLGGKSEDLSLNTARGQNYPFNLIHALAVLETVCVGLRAPALLSE